MSRRRIQAKTSRSRDAQRTKASAWRAIAYAEDMAALAEVLREFAAGAPVALRCGRSGGRSGRFGSDAGLPADLRDTLAEAIDALDDRLHRAGSGAGFAQARAVPHALGWVAVALGGGGEGSEDRLRHLADAALRRAATLLEREHLHETVHRLEKAELLQGALYAIADMAGAPLEMSEMLRGIHRIVSDLMYAENFYIVLYDAARESIRFLYFADSKHNFAPDPETEFAIADLPNSLTVALIRRGQSMMGPSDRVAAELGLASSPQTGPDSEDWLGVPMLDDHGVRGAVVVQSYDRGVRYSEEDRALLTFVARHILTALLRKQGQRELEQRVRDRTRALAAANDELRQEVEERQRAQRLLAAQFRIAELSIGADSMDSFYAQVHAVVGELLYAKNFFIALLSEDGTALEFPYSVDERDPPRPRRLLGRGLTEYVLRTGRPLLVDQAAHEALQAQGEVITSGAPSDWWLGVPLVQGERTIGVLAVQSYSPGIGFNLHDQELLSFVAFHIAAGLERKQAQDRLKLAYAELEQRVEERTHALAEANRELRAMVAERERAEERLTHQALHDSLTGLPNRARLLDRLQAAMARYHRDPRRLFAVLFLDLDRFKVVNDSVGHLIGDEMLVQAGRRIAGAVREPDTVARLGGDEFAILLDEIHGEEEAREVAACVIDALGAPMIIGDKELYTSASIGIALSHPRYHRGEELLRDADAAMYRAKAGGRQRYEVFDEQLRHEALRVLDIESDLRRALTAGDFEPYFQSIVRLGDARRVGLESLLRWRHPTQGLLCPEHFLAVAQDSGLIEQVDWLLFERTCRIAPSLLGPGQYVCINVSPRHFRSPRLTARLLELMAENGLAPSQLRIEITEGALLDDSAVVRDSLLQLREAGVVSQLDDFGTGYSALSYLHRFPIGSLKIDRSFIAGLDSASGHGGAAVVRAILALARSLGIEVIAEGIETPVQRETLIGLGCAYGQGYLFDAPRAAGELSAPDVRLA